MKLVIGGAFQGKRAYAAKRYQIEEGWIDGMTCGLSEIESCRGIFHFHEYVKRLIAQKKSEDAPKVGAADLFAREFAGYLCRVNPDIVVVSNELGYGVVPVDRFDREYRETTGRICTELAAGADEVVRVVCGIGQILKTVGFVHEGQV